MTDVVVETSTRTRRPVSLTSLIAVAAITIFLSLTGSFVIAAILAPTGPRGATGAQGVQGKQGVEGPKGDHGTRGKRGRAGKTGKAGANGVNGASGATIIHDRACSNDISVPLPYC